MILCCPTLFGNVAPNRTSPNTHRDLRWQEQLNFHTPHFDCSLGSPWLAGRQAGKLAFRPVAVGGRPQAGGFKGLLPLFCRLDLLNHREPEVENFHAGLAKLDSRFICCGPPTVSPNTRGTSPTLVATDAAMRKMLVPVAGGGIGGGGALSSTLHWSALASSSLQEARRAAGPHAMRQDSHVSDKTSFLVCCTRVKSSRSQVLKDLPRLAYCPGPGPTLNSNIYTDTASS